MRHAEIIRAETSSHGTFGALWLDGVLFCATGELPFFGGDPGAHNERRKDCIPTGEYLCQIMNSPKFGRVYTLRDVPRRDYILIHAGNFCGDADRGLKSDVAGCILLGEKAGVLDAQKVVLSSKAALKRFMDDLGGQDFMLSISQPVEWTADHVG